MSNTKLEQKKRFSHTWSFIKEDTLKLFLDVSLMLMKLSILARFVQKGGGGVFFETLFFPKGAKILFCVNDT